jgi:hypothetical protein
MNFLKASLIVLFLTAILSVDAAAAVCSDVLITGVWGYAVGASVGQFTADGKGNITAGKQTVSNNGTIVTETFTGTYSVASNCTGTVTLHFTGGPSVNVNIVLNNGGKSVQVIDTTPSTVASGFGASQGTVTCGLTGTRTTFAANLVGKNVTTGPIAYVAQVVLDGKGGVSGSGTFDNHGVFLTASLSGTYKESANCSGSLAVTPKGASTLHFNFVVVNSGKELLAIETDKNTVVVGTLQQ